MCRVSPRMGWNSLRVHTHSPHVRLSFHFPHIFLVPQKALTPKPASECRSFGACVTVSFPILDLKHSATLQNPLKWSQRRIAVAATSSVVAAGGRTPLPQPNSLCRNCLWNYLLGSRFVECCGNSPAQAHLILASFQSGWNRRGETLLSGRSSTRLKLTGGSNNISIDDEEVVGQVQWAEQLSVHRGFC